MQGMPHTADRAAGAGAHDMSPTAPVASTTRTPDVPVAGVAGSGVHGAAGRAPGANQRPALPGGVNGVTAGGLDALQRTAGNAAVTYLLQREPAAPPAAPTPPATTDKDSTAPGGTEVLYFEGKVLRADDAALTDVLRSIVEQRGMMAAAEFTNRLKNANPLTLLKGNERPGLVQDVLKSIDAANAALDKERNEFLATFEETADQAALGILDKSRDTINAELERLGITKVTKDEEGPPTTSYKLGNAGGARDLKAAAAALSPAAAEVDTSRAEMEALRAQLQDIDKAAPPTDLGSGQTLPGARFPGQNPMPPDLLNRFKDANARFMQASEAYETKRRAQVTAAPALGLYTEQPGAAAKLTALSTMSDETLANDVGAQGKKRLENIEEVRPEIGKRFTVWRQTHLRRVSLDQMHATNFQREAVDWKARGVARQDADDSMYFGLLAIGLGLLTLIPTGGTNLLAGIAAAAASAGASLSMYQLNQTMADYNLASAANATDFEKAKAISDDDADGFQLAMDIVGAIGDVIGAAAAYKALLPVVKATKAGEVTAAIRLASTADSVGLKGGAKTKVIANAVASLSEEAIERTGGAVARSGGMDAALGAARMLHGGNHNVEFGKQLEAAIGMMEHVQGRIPETARQMVASGRVRPLTEESLRHVFGDVDGSALWHTNGAAYGLHFRDRGMIFLQGGRDAEAIAGTLIHEATHRMSTHNPVRLNDFMNEAVAHFAERDFYTSLYMEGGPLFGRTPSSPHIRELLALDDDGLMRMIERRYYEGHGHLPEAERRMYLNSGVDANQVVEAIFNDIEHGYQAEFPVIEIDSRGVPSVAGQGPGTQRMPGAPPLPGPTTQPMPGAPPRPAPTTERMPGAPEHPQMRVAPEEPRPRIAPGVAPEDPKIRIGDEPNEADLVPADEEEAPKAMRNPPVRP